MSLYDTVDVFTDEAICQDPIPYFEYLRGKGPITPLPTRNVLAVTGYEEGVAIFRDDEHFSAINTTTGPFLPLQFDPSRDMDAQLTEARAGNPFLTTIISQDLPEHNRSKALLNGIITPARLKENEVFMDKLADQLIDEFAPQGELEVVSGYGQPFAQLVIADLLGVPQEDHAQFRTMIGSPNQMPGTLKGEFDLANNPLARIGMHFAGYVADRRATPRNDVLTRLAQQTLEDGSLPEILEVVAVATFLFGAGQDTTVQLFTGMLRHLGENPELQEKLRQNRALIPDFIEEVLRLDGTTKSTFRYCRKPVSVGGYDIAPGSHIMLHFAAMNRDPRQFANPHDLNIARDKLRTHVAFGRGLHACAGAPLARAEARVTLDRLFDRIKNIRINEAKHGPKGARRYDHLLNYSLRGVTELHIEFDRVS